MTTPNTRGGAKLAVSRGVERRRGRDKIDETSEIGENIGARLWGVSEASWSSDCTVMCCTGVLVAEGEGSARLPVFEIDTLVFEKDDAARLRICKETGESCRWCSNMASGTWLRVGCNMWEGSGVKKSIVAIRGGSIGRM